MLDPEEGAQAESCRIKLMTIVTPESNNAKSVALVLEHPLHCEYSLAKMEGDAVSRKPKEKDEGVNAGCERCHTKSNSPFVVLDAISDAERVHPEVRTELFHPCEHRDGLSRWASHVSPHKHLGNVFTTVHGVDEPMNTNEVYCLDIRETLLQNPTGCSKKKKNTESP